MQEDFPVGSYPLRPGEVVHCFWSEPPISTRVAEGTFAVRRVHLPDTGVLGLASALKAGFR
eukprot:7904591-Alexandrium_andersonii.AAC.1